MIIEKREFQVEKNFDGNKQLISASYCNIREWFASITTAAVRRRPSWDFGLKKDRIVVGTG